MKYSLEIYGELLIRSKPCNLSSKLFDRVTLLAKMLVFEPVRVSFNKFRIMIIKPKFLRTGKIIEICGFCETIFHDSAPIYYFTPKY